MRCDNHNCKAHHSLGEQCPLDPLCSGCHAEGHVWHQCTHLCSHCTGRHKREYCQDFAPGVGGKPPHFGPMPADWPYDRSFQTDLVSIQNKTDYRDGPRKKRKVWPPPRATFDTPAVGSSASLPHRPPQLIHGLPPRPPSNVIVATTTAGVPVPPVAPAPVAGNSSGRHYVSASTQTAFEVTESARQSQTRTQPKPQNELPWKKRRHSVLSDLPAPPLPRIFSMRARAPLPPTFGKRKKLPLGLGRYSAMPAPTTYGDEKHDLQKEIANPQPEPDFVEGTVWEFPPCVIDWEKAVGFVRPTKAQQEADNEEARKAWAVAKEKEEPDQRLPRYSNRSITVRCVDAGQEQEVEIFIRGFGFQQLASYNWVPGDGLGRKGLGIRIPILSVDPEKKDEKIVADPQFKFFRPEADKEHRTIFTSRFGSFPFEVGFGNEAKCWDFIVTKHPQPEAGDEVPPPAASRDVVMADDKEDEDEDDDFGLSMMYGERPVVSNPDLAILDWSLAAKNPPSLQRIPAAASSTMASEPRQPIYKETWKRKEKGKVVEKIQSPIESSKQPAKRRAMKIKDLTEEDIEHIMDINLISDDEDVQPLDPNDDHDAITDHGMTI